MKTLLLATGENQKLRPLSDRLPAPLVPIANRPVMLYCIDLLARQGYKHMLVSLHHQAGAIESYFGSGQRWGITLDYVLQRDSLGDAGSLAWARKELTDTFLVFPADTLIDLDITAVLAQHREQGNAATLVTHIPSASSPLHLEPPISLEDSGRLFENAIGASVTPWQLTGVYVFEPQVLEFIPERTPMDIRTQLIPALLQAGLPLQTYKMQGYWNALETLEDYQQAQQTFLRSSSTALSGNHTWLQFLRLNSQPIRDGVWVGRNSVIHPAARLVPPIFIGENCRIGRGVDVGPDAVLGANVIVDDDATVRNSTVLDHTYLGRLVNVEYRVVQQEQVIDIYSGEMAKIVDPFLVGSTHRTVDESPLKRTFELILALVLLLLSLPFAAVLSIIIALISGRVFEPVTRVRQSTKSANSEANSIRTFTLFRFARGLRHGQENSFSRWLQRWQLNRLPELWNVVRGDLRLVGVQPASPEEVAQYREPWEQEIRACAPGITGLWFTQTSPESSPEEIRLADAYYTATRSWDKDLLILRQTPLAWVRRAREGSMYQAMRGIRRSGHAA